MVDLNDKEGFSEPEAKRRRTSCEVSHNATLDESDVNATASRTDIQQLPGSRSCSRSGIDSPQEPAKHIANVPTSEAHLEQSPHVDEHGFVASMASVLSCSIDNHSQSAFHNSVIPSSNNDIRSSIHPPVTSSIWQNIHPVETTKHIHDSLPSVAYSNGVEYQPSPYSSSASDSPHSDSLEPDPKSVSLPITSLGVESHLLPPPVSSIPPPTVSPGSTPYYYPNMQSYSSGTTSSSGYSGTAPTFYNHHTGTQSSYAGVFSQPYPGARPVSKHVAGQYLNPYPTSHFVPTSSSSQHTTQPHYTYGGKPSNSYGSSAFTNGNAQFSTTQQPLDYTSYSAAGYGQTYPYYGQPYGYPSLSATTPSTPPYPIPQLQGSLAANELSYGGVGLDGAPTPLDVIVKAENSLTAQQANAPGRKGRAQRRGRRQNVNASPEVENSLDRVFIWDLDETIIVLNSLLKGTYCGKNATTSVQYGMQMEQLIFHLADNHLFFRDLEKCDQINIDDVSPDDNAPPDINNAYVFSPDGSIHAPAGGPMPNLNGVCLPQGCRGGVDFMRQLSVHYRHIKTLYNRHKDNVGAILSSDQVEDWLKLRDRLEDHTDHWLTTAMKSLTLINRRTNCINVLVTRNQLVLALSKLLLFGLAPVFSIENVYSATKIGRESCFERVMARFGKRCTYVIIGNDKENEIASKALNIPFWRVSGHSDLEMLHHALEMEHL